MDIRFENINVRYSGENGPTFIVYLFGVSLECVNLHCSNQRVFYRQTNINNKICFSFIFTKNVQFPAHT